MQALRPVTIQRHFTAHTPGSVLYRCGDTVVLCTASLENKVPDWMVGKGKGWITAEYNMLPGSTSPRKSRERSGKIDGRTTEIQRLIGRSFRAIADLKNEDAESAIESLKRGENLLEQITTEGKEVDRNLIIVILYNQACCYQRLNLLVDCASYLDGTIYNLE